LLHEFFLPNAVAFGLSSKISLLFQLGQLVLLFDQRFLQLLLLNFECFDNAFLPLHTLHQILDLLLIVRNLECKYFFELFLLFDELTAHNIAFLVGLEFVDALLDFLDIKLFQLGTIALHGCQL